MAALAPEDYSSKALKFGDIVAGTVVRVGPKEILIDIGAKSEGMVASKELEKMSAEAVIKYHPGDQVLAFVLSPESHDGAVLLSLARAQLERDWREAAQLLQADQVFEAQVAGFNKGGLIVRIGKVRGFVPTSQLEGVARRTEGDTHPPDLSAWVGKKIKLKITELDRERNRLILSERAALRDLRKVEKERMLADLKEGDVRTGTVTSLADFGAFVDLGGVDGLIHITELAWNKVNHPREVVQVGDTVQVQILSIGRDKQRIALSLKRLQPEPWTRIEETYHVGDLVTGTITKLASFGAFARVGDGIEGLIHISELSDRRVQHPKEAVQEGQTLQLRVVRIDATRRRLGLSLKRVTDEALEFDDAPVEEPWAENLEPVPDLQASGV
jgi:small subunit ribosomal protein S1